MGHYQPLGASGKGFEGKVAPCDIGATYCSLTGARVGLTFAGLIIAITEAKRAILKIFVLLDSALANILNRNELKVLAKFLLVTCTVRLPCS